MNEIITLPRLAEIIARTGIADLSASEKFIKVFSSIGDLIGFSS